MQRLDESLEAQRWRFIQAGTFLVLEKLKQAVLRRLLKRVAQIYVDSNPEKSSQLPLGAASHWLPALMLTMTMPNLDWVGFSGR